MTEIIMYNQQLLTNSNFARVINYGWTLAGAWTVSDGYITAPAAPSVSARQNGVLKIGRDYVARVKVFGRTAGQVTVDSGGAPYSVISSNGIHEFVFTSDGNDFVLEASTAFDGSIANVTVTESPEQVTLDIDGDVPVPFTFNVDDVFKLQDRKTAFTKTINVPGTDNNKKAFDHMHMLSTSSQFNPMRRTRCVVKNSGITLIDGFIVVNGMNLRDSQVTYECNVFGQMTGFFANLGDMNVRDLDFSDYDHDFTLENITLTWPLALATGGFSLGMSYVKTGPGSYAAAQNVVHTAPSLSSISSGSYNGNTCVDLVFSAPHGFTAGDSVYIDTNNSRLSGTHRIAEAVSSTRIRLHMAFANLTTTAFTTCVVTSRTWNSIGYIYPLCDNGTYVEYNGDIVQGAQYFVQADRSVKTNGSYPMFFDSLPFFQDPYTGTTPVTAGGNHSEQWFLADDGSSSAGAVFPKRYVESYTAQGQMPGGAFTPAKEYAITHWKAGDDFYNIGGPIDYLNGVLVADGFYDGYTWEATGTTPTIWTHGTELRTLVYDVADTTYYRNVRGKDPNAKLRAKNESSNNWFIGDFIPHIYAREIFDKMFAAAGYRYDSPLLAGDVFSRMTVQMSQGFGVMDNTGDLLPPGTVDTVVMNDWLPDIKLSAFFTDVMNMFDLVAMPDNEDNRLLHLVSRVDFLNSTIFEMEVDASSDMHVQTSVSLVPLKYRFTYAESGDTLVQEFDIDFGKKRRQYADAEFVSDQEIDDRTEEVPLVFKQTVMAGNVEGLYDVTNYNYAAQDKVFSAAYSGEIGKDDKKRDAGPRIFMTGFRGTNDKYTLKSYTGVTPNSLSYIEQNFAPQSYVVMGAGLAKQYCYAHHVDNVYDAVPENDLAWSPPLGQYFPYTYDYDAWNRNCMVRKYWFKHLLQVMSSDSKILTCRVRMSQEQISKLDQRAQYDVMGIRCRLNKISDWDSNGDGTCNAELILVV